MIIKAKKTKPSLFFRILMIRSLIILILFLGQVAVGWGQASVIAHFGLNGNLNVDNDNAVGIPYATNNGLQDATAGITCEGTDKMYARSDNNAYLDIFINTSGYENVQISWQQHYYSGTGGGTGDNRWNFFGDYDNNGTNDISVTNNPNGTTSCATVTINLPATFDNQGDVKFRIQHAGAGSRYLYLDDIYIRGDVIPQYLAQFISNDLGSAPWCAGETRTISVVVKNVGQASWTSAAAPGGINFSFWWDNQGQDSNPRQYPFSALAPGQQQTVSMSVTAPTASGSYFLTFDLVNENDCWFRGNTGSCGPGNITYSSSSVTVNALPSATVTGQSNISCFADSDGSITVTASGGSGSGYEFSINNGTNWTSGASNPHIFTGLSAGTGYQIRVIDSNGCESPSF